MAFSKVNQIDGMFLDVFYQNSIIEQLLKPFPFDNLKRTVVEIVVKTAYLAKGLWLDKQTEGNRIYNLTYMKPNRSFLFIHLLAEIFNIIHKIYKERLGVGFKIWNACIFINWLLFLLTQKYRTAAERLGKVMLMAKDPEKMLNIDYSYSNRVLFFKILSDTIKTVLPFLKIDSLLKFVYSEISYGGSDSSGCIICDSEDVVSPSSFKSCSHIACYICLKSSNSSKCPKCKS